MYSVVDVSDTMQDQWQDGFNKFERDFVKASGHRFNTRQSIKHLVIIIVTKAEKSSCEIESIGGKRVLGLLRLFS
jgi:secreted trypsin-like serine protease